MSQRLICNPEVTGWVLLHHLIRWGKRYVTCPGLLDGLGNEFDAQLILALQHILQVSSLGRVECLQVLQLVS